MRFNEKSISAALFKRRQQQLQTELDAAYGSLADSERQLEINLNDLEIALDVVPSHVVHPGLLGG